MPTIREVIEESFEWHENHAKQKGYFHHKALRKLLADKVQEMEAAYQKRIEELEEKARVYDLLMEMPSGTTIMKTINTQGPFLSHHSNYYSDGKVTRKEDWGKTPQEALLKLKEKLNLQK